MFITIQDIYNYLDQKGLFHIDFSLNRVKKVLESFNINKLNCPVIQVLGTNGKGSTSTMLASIAKNMGYKCGLYTSPHMLNPKERIKIDLNEVDDDIWIENANKLISFLDELTYFEFLTVLAILIFKDLDVVILEAGMGGTYDATSVIYADMHIFVPIGLDHTEYLGSSLSKIAIEKAGAIKENSLVVLAKRNEKLAKYFRKNSSQLFICQNENKYELKLSGNYQQDNANLADFSYRILAKRFNLKYSKKHTLQALRNTFIAGRVQQVQIQDKNIVLDAGHNPHGLLALAKSLKKMDYMPNSVIFFALADKDIYKMAQIVENIAKGAPIFIPDLPNNKRAASASELIKKLNIKATPCQNMQNALNICLGNNVLICGSIYLLAEFYKLYPQFLFTGNYNE